MEVIPTDGWMDEEVVGSDLPFLMCVCFYSSLPVRGHRYMLDCLEKQTGQSQEKLLKDFSRNTYFTPETAEEYGLIDQVLRPRRKAGK